MLLETSLVLLQEELQGNVPVWGKNFFDFFINIWPSLKARLPKKILLSKVESLYRDYCEWKREEDVEPENRSFRKEWLKDGAKGTKF